MYNSINFTFTYSDPSNTTVSFTPLNVLLCPSDPGSHIDDITLGDTGTATTSYGTCDGDWYVWSVNWGTTNSVGPRNSAMYGPNYARTIAQITDGTSNSLAVAEGYIGHGQMRSCSKAAGTAPSDPVTGTYSPTNIPLPGPNSTTALAYLLGSCATKGSKAGGPIGHTRWCNGGVYYSGFTTAMPPNSAVLFQSSATVPVAVGSSKTTTNASNFGKVLPMDWDWIDENDGGPTYMSLAASSFHPGGVNAAFGDGSVRYVKNSVSPFVWRALGTIAGGETISADSY